MEKPLQTKENYYNLEEQMKPNSSSALIPSSSHFKSLTRVEYQQNPVGPYLALTAERAAGTLAIPTFRQL